MLDDVELAETIRANGEAWNAIAPMRDGQPADYYLAGGSALDAIEVALAGDVRGREVLQLACSTGDEVISWSMLGASAHGIDISQVHVDKAIAKATAVGAACDFRCADMFALPADLTDLDLVYISWGGVNWAPDIDTWAEAVASRLRPGGALLISEMHPLWFSLSVTGENALSVRADYFESGSVATTWDASKEPVGGRSIDGPPPEVVHLVDRLDGHRASPCRPPDRCTRRTSRPGELRGTRSSSGCDPRRLLPQGLPSGWTWLVESLTSDPLRPNQPGNPAPIRHDIGR